MVPLSPERETRGDDLDLRQLRHHTKNALQRLIGLIAETQGLQETPLGSRLAHDLEQRIFLSAAISNALFGLTRAPGSMHQRLESLCRSVVELLADPAQKIHLTVEVTGTCPIAQRVTVLRVAHELVGNAVRHGLHARATGQIDVRLDHARAVTTLMVRDDGWGCEPMAEIGEGLAVAHELSDQFGGTLCLISERGASDGNVSRRGTLARLELPTDADRRRDRPGQARSRAISSSSINSSPNFSARRSMP
jgi:two-component sensor histidine kinase